MSLCVAQERIFLPILHCIIYGPAIQILSFIYATVFSSLAATSWWSSFHKIWQQSNCSSWLGFSGDSIPPSHYFFLYFCLGLQQIFLFLSWNFHSFIVYTGVCGSFIYVWFFYLCVKREVFHLYALLECNIATFLCFWVVCIKTKEMCACRFLLFCGWLALS